MYIYFKATMDQMDLISRNFDDRSINFLGPIILAAETSHKDNIHLVAAMKVDDGEDLMKSMKKN